MRNASLLMVSGADALKKPGDLSVYWQHPENGRYYIVHIGKDLFGGWVQWHAFGGRGAHTGRDFNKPVKNCRDALRGLAHEAKRRAQHHYQVVAVQPPYRSGLVERLLGSNGV